MPRSWWCRVYTANGVEDPIMTNSGKFIDHMRERLFYNLLFCMSIQTYIIINIIKLREVVKYCLFEHKCIYSFRLFYRWHAKVPDKACKYWDNYRRIQRKEGSGNPFPYVSVVMTCKAYQLLLYNDNNNGFLPVLACRSRKALRREFLCNCLEISLQMNSTSALYLKVLTAM
jgi:hypothetical protein